jgi:hypothetical protein
MFWSVKSWGLRGGRGGCWLWIAEALRGHAEGPEGLNDADGLCGTFGGGAYPLRCAWGCFATPTGHTTYLAPSAALRDAMQKCIAPTDSGGANGGVGCLPKTGPVLFVRQNAR